MADAENGSSRGSRSAPYVVGRNPLLGFGSVSAKVAALLLAIFVLVSVFPMLLQALALVPANTLMAHFFFWNVLTAGFVETSFLGVTVACLAILIVGKQLEPLWGSKELLRFLLVVNTSVGIVTFFASVFMYTTTMQERFLFKPYNGFVGAIAGLLVAVKQLIPEQETKVCFIVIKTKELASLYFAVYLLLFCIFKGHFGDFFFVFTGTYSSWVYLRFFQWKENGLHGDMHNDAFAFTTFFPPKLRKPISLATTVCFRTVEHCPCCAALHQRKRNAAAIMKVAPLPGSTEEKAQRYRQRALEMLEQKMHGGGELEGTAPQRPSIVRSSDLA